MDEFILIILLFLFIIISFNHLILIYVKFISINLYKELYVSIFKFMDYALLNAT